MGYLYDTKGQENIHQKWLKITKNPENNSIQHRYTPPKKRTAKGAKINENRQ